MGALGDERASLAARLRALDIQVRDTPSVGHISPPAAIIVPAPEWIVPNAMMGPILHSRLSLRIVLLTGKISAGESLATLEELVERVLLDVVGDQWLVGTVDGPGAITVAGTDYLSASVTITRAVTIQAAP